ncbi:MAG: TetR/AcrR family transcriptional regulator [Calditrichaeota bacterium]|nr:TetR/AcrR family transcriptional regulator [Calditrichota bacterium]MBT7789395.1 TetR/AcrR family transcriptional regulator [Calditrichota bacterium]
MSDSRELTEAQENNQIRFFNSAEGLFERHGYKKTTIMEICSSTSLSKPTFYDLFKDKADFFARLLLFITETEMKSWKHKLPEQSSPSDQVKAFIDFYATSLAIRPIFKLILEDPEVMEKFGWIIYHQPNSPIFSTLMEIVENGVNTGDFRKIDPDAAVWIIYAILDSMYVLLPMITGKAGAAEDQALAGDVKKFILNGLAKRDRDSKSS